MEKWRNHPRAFGDTLTQEDIEEAQRGHVFTLNQDVPFIRYFGSRV